MVGMLLLWDGRRGGERYVCEAVLGIALLTRSKRIGSSLVASTHAAFSCPAGSGSKYCAGQ